MKKALFTTHFRVFLGLLNVLGLLFFIVYSDLEPVAIQLPPKANRKGITLLRALSYETKRHPFAMSILVGRNTLYRNFNKKIEPAYEEFRYVRRQTFWPRLTKEHNATTLWSEGRDKVLNYIVQSLIQSGGDNWSLSNVDDEAIRSTARKNLTFPDDSGWGLDVVKFFPSRCVRGGTLAQ